MKEDMVEEIIISKFIRNISHDLWQIFIQLISILTNSNKTFVFNYSKINNIPNWQKGLLYLILKHFNVKDKKENKKMRELIINPIAPHNNNNRKIVIENMFLIRKIIYNYYGIIDKPLIEKYKVLYLQKEKKGARTFFNHDDIAGHFDLILETIPTDFDKQVNLFSKISHLVTPEGSWVANIISMNSEAKILCILNTGIWLDDRLCHYDNWAKQFGGEELIREVNCNIIAIKLVPSGIRELSWTFKYNTGIYIENILKEKIIRWLTH